MSDGTTLMPPGDLPFLEAEAETLRALGRARIPDEPCDAPVHGDLWILVGPDGWHVLDWDEVALGDPEFDLAALLHDAQVHGLDVRPLLPAEAGARERVEILLRAADFDEIVDPLSDLTDVPAGHPDVAAL